VTVEFREIHDVEGIARVAVYFSEVWNTSVDVLSSETLHCIRHANGSVIGAFDGDRLAGATVAIFSPPAEKAVYSMIAAADPGVGMPLKLAQKDWALRHGAETIRWTYDPLVSRNARFNLVKLGAVVTEYTVDFYGPMRDGVNDGDESDRLTVRWDLTASPRPEPEGGPVGEIVRLAPDGGALEITDGERIWCRVPSDVVAVRRDDPEVAAAWRKAVRGAFTDAFARGYVATSMSRDSWYLLERA
jgi:predicted GNAT superfamily acetyltransferase